VRKAVAGGYARVGRAKESLALYKTVPMQDATAGDFQGAIGAALAANDKTQAEIWLRQALERYTRDPAILTLAARYEQARGDNQRAADYYRASLAAMPPASPVDRLAHDLVYPEQDTKAHRAVTAADLQHLLDPNYEPFAEDDQAAASAPTRMAGFQSRHHHHPRSAGAGPQFYRQQYRTQQAPGNPRWSESAYSGLRLRNASYHRNDMDAMPFGYDAGPPQEAPSAASQAPVPEQPYYGQPQELSLNAPHSMASDAWKGLIFSLMSAGRNQDALNELAQIPPDVRRQLEADVEFVQSEASLFVALGDLNHAVDTSTGWRTSTSCAAPHHRPAWRCNTPGCCITSRKTANCTRFCCALTAARTWSPRSASKLKASGPTGPCAGPSSDGQRRHPRGVEILQAASEDYPNNLSVRRAVAGAYAKVGRYGESLTLYKSDFPGGRQFRRLPGSHRRGFFRHGHGPGGGLAAPGPGALSRRPADSGAGRAL
jgi:tetratricopeptide (TPR) repeat protein